MTLYSVYRRVAMPVLVQVTVSVLEKGLKDADVEVEVSAKRLTVRRKQDMALLFDKVLYEEVLPEKKRTRFMPSKVY